jgi:hypothetical protein
MQHTAPGRQSSILTRGSDRDGEEMGRGEEQGRNGPFDVFRFCPSLSTTSCAQLTRGTGDAGAPRRTSVGGASVLDGAEVTVMVALPVVAGPAVRSAPGRGAAVGGEGGMGGRVL